MPNYQFNSFTGRLRESASFQPLYPVRPKPLQPSGGIIMAYESTNVKAASSELSEFDFYGETKNLDPKFLKDRLLFERNLNVPVYLVKGKSDRILAGIAMVLCGISVVKAFTFLIQKTQTK